MYWMKVILKKYKHDSSLFIGQSYFFNDGSQCFLLFQPTFNTFTMLAGIAETIVEWESKVVSNRNINPLIAPNHSLSPKFT